jgi:hypothetical protein
MAKMAHPFLWTWDVPPCQQPGEWKVKRPIEVRTDKHRLFVKLSYDGEVVTYIATHARENAVAHLTKPFSFGIGVRQGGPRRESNPHLHSSGLRKPRACARMAKISNLVIWASHRSPN